MSAYLQSYLGGRNFHGHEIHMGTGGGGGRVRRLKRPPKRVGSTLGSRARWRKNPNPTSSPLGELSLAAAEQLGLLPDITQRSLAGNLIPDNTRTATSSTGLMVSFLNGGGAGRELYPTVITPKREVKQYILSQDHFRRYHGIGDGSLLVRSGSVAPEVEMRIDSRTFSTSRYALRARMTPEDIAEADTGVDVRGAKRMAVQSVIELEFEQSAVVHATTQGNYATGHFTTVTNWDNVSGDPIANLRSGQKSILTDCGGLAMQMANVEWVLALGFDGAVALEANADLVDRWSSKFPNAAATPSFDWIADALGVDRIVVSTMAAGPAQQTTSLPTVTSNTFVWSSTLDKAALFLVDRSASVSGTAIPGRFSTAGAFATQSPMESNYVGSPAERDFGRDVEWVQYESEWTLQPIAIDDTTNQKMVAAHLFEDILA